MKHIIVPDQHWSAAEIHCERYLGRAAEDAYCLVWFQAADDFKFAYSQRNPASTFTLKEAPKASSYPSLRRK
jgi:hypothetical protein